jgi:hypothetical protein
MILRPHLSDAAFPLGFHRHREERSDLAISLVTLAEALRKAQDMTGAQASLSSL